MVELTARLQVQVTTAYPRSHTSGASILNLSLVHVKFNFADREGIFGEVPGDGVITLANS